MKQMICIFVLISLISGCAVHDPYLVHHTYDEFDQVHTFIMKGNILAAEEAFEALTDKFDLSVTRIDTDEKVEFYLIVNFHSQNWNELHRAGWMFIDEGESLIFLINGRRIGLKSTGYDPYHTEITSSGGVMEFAYYKVNKRFLKALFFANDIKVKIVGKKRTFKRKFTERFFTKYRRFYKEYVENT